MDKGITREELHALVWSQPMSSAAKARGISDVALAKQCRRAGVPVPPRGYWNKVQAGKPATAQPLPPLPVAAAGAAPLGSLFPALAAGMGTTSSRDGLYPAPVFQDIAVATRRIQEAVGEVKMPSRLTHPHPSVAKLLRQDEERRTKVSPGSSSYAYYGPKFATPIQQRRLRILSALLLALEGLGCKSSGSTHAGERFSVAVGGRWVYVLLAVESGKYGDPFYRGRGGTRQTGERLRLDVIGHSPDREPPSRTWRDGDAPLEAQLTEVACGIMLKAEQDARELLVWRHKHDAEEHARKEKEALLAAEQAEEERVARDEEAARRRVQVLADGADALERAERIRRYVAAVRARVPERQEDADAATLERWAAWALRVANEIDPVASGAFTRDVGSHEK